MASTRTIDFSSRQLTSLSSDDLAALPYRPSELLLHHNLLPNFPESLSSYFDTLTSIILHHNKIISFPAFSLPKLRHLDLSHNLIRTLPSTLPTFPTLTELNISRNQITLLPPTLPTAFPSLETLLLAGNGLPSIDADLIQKMEALRVLDFGDNEIGTVPPELGLCTGLRSLRLEGNRFRVPRRQVLEGGTDVVLEYLRGRIVT